MGTLGTLARHAAIEGWGEAENTRMSRLRSRFSTGDALKCFELTIQALRVHTFGRVFLEHLQ